MELNQIERTFIGIPAEFYDSCANTILTKDNIKPFAYSAKVLVTKTTQSFFSEVGQAFALLRDCKAALNGCKTYTCLDLDIFDNHREALEYLEKLQVLAILDIDNTRNKTRLEGFLRKWFEASKSLIILYPNDLSKLEGYSQWFIDLLRKKSEWR